MSAKSKGLTWELIRHLAGVDDGERKERTGEADDNETAEYMKVYKIKYQMCQ